MFQSAKLADFLYCITTDNKRVFIGFAVKTKANGFPDLSVFEGVFKSLDGNTDVPDNTTIHLASIDKSTEARVEITKHINTANNGAIIGFLCKTIPTLNYAIKIMEANSAEMSIQNTHNFPNSSI